MESNNFVNECKNRANANRLGKFSIDGEATTITNNNKLQEISFNDGCYVDGNIIGSTFSKKVTCKLLNIGNLNLADKIIRPEIGVKYADSSTEYIKIGKYTIETPKTSQTSNIGEITGYDDFSKLENEYICGLDFSTGNKSISDFYDDLCEQLELIPTTLTFLNSTIELSGNPFLEGTKIREVLSDICEVSCTFPDIDLENNSIDLKWLNDSIDYTFETSDYSILNGGKVQYGPVNSLVIKDSQINGENVTRQDSQSITSNGETQVSIIDNSFLYTEALRTLAIDNIWNRIKDLTYIDCTLETCYGKPFLKKGNKIKIKRNDGTEFLTYILLHNFVYDGTFKSIISSPAMTKQETNRKNTQDVKTKFKNIERSVDKINGEIVDIIEITDDQSSQISSHTQSINEINQTITNDLSFSKTVQGYDEVTCDNAENFIAIDIEMEGQNTITNDLYFSDDLYPMDDLYPSLEE